MSFAAASRSAAYAGALVALGLLAAPAAAQNVASADGVPPLATAPGLRLDGSPPPVFPESITRDSLGRATVRAIRLEEPLTMDGVLDESVYAEYPAFEGFIQVTPDVGEPSSERSEIWILYDDANVYVVCRCWTSTPPDTWVANELRRDTNGLRNNDHLGVMFDTFYDRRSGFMFYANPLGARADYSVIDEGGSNTDWNPVWDVKTGTFDGGWAMEMQIPFKSLRYRSGSDQVWGIQMRRAIRHRNEWAYLNPVPPFLAGPQALNRISAGGTVVGLDLPDASANLEVKPYAIAGLTTNRVVDPAFSNDADGDVGVDVKYGVTANLTADLTINTDFAQVEVDEQQVNLTRFNLFFPEKREFFLEGRGMFDFGGGGGGGMMMMMMGGGNDAPNLFYSRRIGLDRGRQVPIRAGGRLTGKVGAYGIGLLNIQTGDEPAVGAEGANFTVVRLKRDILRRSSIGGMFTNRTVSSYGEASNRAYGVDASFAFFTNLNLDAWYARTEGEGLGDDAGAYQASANYAGDRYGGSLAYLTVGRDFTPDVGFTRRTDFRKTSGSLRFSPRPASIEWIRRLTWSLNLSYLENGAGQVETRSAGGRFSMELQSSDQLNVNVGRDYERLFQPFRVGEDVTVPVGAYTFTDARVQYQFGEQRRVSGNVAVSAGEFYHGTIRSLSLGGARAVVNNHLSLEPGVTVNRIELPEQPVLDQTLLRTRVDYAFTPRMFASALLQYSTNGDVFSSNLRFRWEYRPGSELFVVWTDERDTADGGIGLRNRALAVKVTGLLRR